MSTSKKELYPKLPPELLHELDELCGNAEGGAAAIGRDLLAVLEHAVLRCEDGVQRRDADRMYFPWQLMKVLCGPPFAGEA